MTTIVIDPVPCFGACRRPTARAQARRRFRLAALLFCIAMTMTLYASSGERAELDGGISERSKAPCAGLGAGSIRLEGQVDTP